MLGPLHIPEHWRSQWHPDRNRQNEERYPTAGMLAPSGGEFYRMGRRDAIGRLRRSRFRCPEGVREVEPRATFVLVREDESNSPHRRIIIEAEPIRVAVEEVGPAPE